MRDRHAELEWHAHHATPSPEPTWARPAPIRTPRASGLSRVLAVVALALVAAGMLLVLGAPVDPVRVECAR